VNVRDAPTSPVSGAHATCMEEARSSRLRGVRASLALYRRASLLASGASDALFVSTARWLHPLFALERYLARQREREEYLLYDKIVGMASAYLIIYCGISMLIAEICSRGATRLLARHGIEYQAERIVPSIGCSTEIWLAECEIASVEEARRMLATLRASNVDPQRREWDSLDIFSEAR